MSATAFFLGPSRAQPELEKALLRMGVKVDSVAYDALDTLAVEAYDGHGVLIIDERQPEAAVALASHATTLLPTILVATSVQVVPKSAFWLRRQANVERMAEHVLEVVNEPANLRQSPRVSVILPMDINGIPALARNVSLYGIAIDMVPGFIRGRACDITVPMAGGAIIKLTGEVVDARGDKLAIRCRPNDAPDLLVWLYYLLGELEDSPLHGRSDPAQSLFADVAGGGDTDHQD